MVVRKGVVDFRPLVERRILAATGLEDKDVIAFIAVEDVVVRGVSSETGAVLRTPGMRSDNRKHIVGSTACLARGVFRAWGGKHIELELGELSSSWTSGPNLNLNISGQRGVV